MSAAHKSESPAATGLNATNQKTQRKFSAKSCATEAQRERILDALRLRPHTSHELRCLGIYQAPARIKELRAEAELFAKHVGIKLARKDALLRECLAVLSASYAEHYDEALELRLEASIKTELGEQA